MEAMKIYTSEQYFNIYLQGKNEMINHFKNQLEFILKCGNVNENDIIRLLQLCEKFKEINKPVEL